MTTIENIQRLAKQPHKFCHASNLITKLNGNLTNQQRLVLHNICEKYIQYVQNNIELQGYTEEIIISRVQALNDYYNFLHNNQYDNMFNAQSKFRSTILEEFLYILFRDYIKSLKIQFDQTNVLNSGQIKAYTNMFFKATNFEEFIKNPQVGINTKDQDFAIYRELNLTVNNQTRIIMVPAIAIEAKTYIDKTMLDSIIATAEKIKTGNPYVRFITIAEHYDVGADVDPAYSRIDQIYILRKCRRRDWNIIDKNVVLRIFKESKYHIERPWSDINKRLSEDGIIL